MAHANRNDFAVWDTVVRRMTRKNIKVPEDLFLALRDDKGDQQSWPHYLEQECLHSDDDDLAAIRDAVETVEARTGRIERELDNLHR